MAPRNTNQSSSAESVVFDNLDLDPADLGAEDTSADDDLGDDSQDDQGDQDLSDDRGNEPELRQQPEKKPLTDLRASHTPPKPLAQGAPRADAKGNLIDASGKVIAKAGGEARLYTTLHQTRQGLAAAQRQGADLNTRLTKAVEIGQGLARQVQDYRAREEQITALGVKPEDHISALQLYSQMEKDPAGTLKKLLTRAAANGIDITQLGITGGAGGLDLKSIVDTLREEMQTGLKPLKDRTAQEQQQQQENDRVRQATEKANQDVQDFFGANQEAVPYLPVFEQALKDPRTKGMSLGELWARIQLNLVRNPPQRDRRDNANPQQRRNLPNGRSMPQEGSSEMAPVDSSYDSIVRDVMASAGIR